MFAFRKLCAGAILGVAACAGTQAFADRVTPAPVPAVAIPDKVRTPDMGLIKDLTDAGVLFTTHANGFVSVKFNQTKTPRAQVVLISPDVEDCAGVKLRHISTCAAKDATILSQPELIRIMQDSATRKFGAWQVNRSGNLVWTAKLPVDMPPKNLRSFLDASSCIADEMEATLSEQDEF